MLSTGNYYFIMGVTYFDDVVILKLSVNTIVRSSKTLVKSSLPVNVII